MVGVKLKILMIHGYTETGESFRADISGLEKALQEAFPAAPAPNHHPLYPGGLELFFPTGTWRLRPTDWARYIPGTDPGYGWFYKVPDDEEFPGLDQGLTRLGDLMKAEGPFAGVIGYSQGGFLTGLISSMLEPGRRVRFEEVEKESGGIPFPAAFEDVHPIKFSISCCGFAGLSPRYKAYYSPPITSLLHVNGRLDDIVYDKRSRTLIDASLGNEEEKVLIHPGGHTVPTTQVYTDAIIMYIKRKIAA